MIIIIKILINYKNFYFNKGIYASSEKKGTVMPILSLFSETRSQIRILS